jgi:hypothetical protein
MRSVNLEVLRAAAIAEDWELVDGAIDDVVAQTGTLDAARALLDDEDDNVRDLGASLYEADADYVLDADVTETLKRMVDTDPHEFARFRAACALAVRGDKTQRVINELEAATKNDEEEVADHARELLAQLGSTN